MSYAILTNTGRQKEAIALANGTPLVLTEIAWGDGDYAPSGAEAALQNEVGRKPINGTGNVENALNTAFFEIILDVAEGPYVIREAGLFDEDGDLFAIVKYDPPINKPADSVSALLRITIAFSNLENLILQVQSVDAYASSDRKVIAGTGLLGGGDLTSDRTFETDFATLAEALAGQLTTKSITPATLAAALGKTDDGLPLHLDLSNSGQPSQNIAKDTSVRCNNMVVVGGNAGAMWNGHRFTVTPDTLGIYGVLNRLNTNNEDGEGAATWKNGVEIMNYQLSANTGTANVMPFTHFVPLLNDGDYIEFYHYHKSGGSRTNNSSKAQIVLISPFTPPA